MDIALWHGISSSTVHKIKRGRTKAYRGIRPAPSTELPPPGPYVVVAKVQHDSDRAAALSRDRLIADLTTLLEHYKSLGTGANEGTQRLHRVQTLPS